MLRFTLTASLSLLVLTGASRARAEAPRRPSVRLDYERKKGAEQCPDEAELRTHVAAGLGRDPFTPEGSRRIAATVARKGRGFVGTMDLFENGEKTWTREPIEDPSCKRLVDEILALSIVINLAEPPAPPPAAPALLASTPAYPSPPPAEKVAPPAEEPAVIDPEAPRLRLALGAGVEIGDGPTPSPLFSLNAGVRWPIVSVALELRTDLPLIGTGAGGVPVQTHVFAGAVTMCLHASYFHGCGLFAAGAQRGGAASSPSSYPSTAYASAGGRAGVELPLTARFAVQVTGDVLVAINPMSVRYNLHEVWRSAPVAGAVQGGFVTYF